VSERDAFGNHIDDAPAGTPATATATLVPPLVLPTPTVFTPPERVRGRFDWTDKLVGLVLLALFVAPFAIGSWFAWTTWHDTARPAVGAIKSIQRPPTPGAGDDGAGVRTPPAATPPAGLGARSLLRPAAVGRVLASARRDPGGRLGLLRLAPERADLQLARRGGGLDLLQIGADGGRTLVRSPGSAPSHAIIFSAIDRGAPQRLVRAAARRLRRPARAVDYVVLIDVLGGPRWSAYFTGGAAFQGDAHGRIIRRIS
jgi:hypothetical protein